MKPMKTLFYAAVVTLISCAAQAQNPAPPAQSAAPPPVKMGLWQGTTTVKVSGFQVPPEVAEKMKATGKPVPGTEPRTIETQSCLTPEKWKEMITKMQDRENCKLTNVKQDATEMSADIACQTSGGGSAMGRVQANFITSEKVHGIGHMEIMTPRQPQAIIMDTTFDSTYQGADCKGISPDTPKVIMK
jgi:hypothetical protein